MQARWAACVFAARGANLPPEADRRADVEAKRALMFRRYFASPKHTVQVDAISYMVRGGGSSCAAGKQRP